MVRVLGYARVSTDEQARGRGRVGEYTSTDAQLDLLARHCQTLSDATGTPHALVRTFRDEGYSGKNTNRPDLTALTVAVEAREGDMVMIYRLDRISRRVVDFLRLDEQYARHGVSILSIREQFDTSTPLGRMIRVILLAFAELERETTVQRVSDKLTALVATGRWAGGRAPFGWRRHLDFGLERNPPMEPYLLRIFEMYGQEGASPAQIAAWLNGEAVPTPQGGAFWCGSTVRSVLSAPAHRGIQRSGHREGVWTFGRIVPPDLVAKVDARFSPAKGRRGPNRVTWPWQNACICGLCGFRLRRQPRPHKGATYEYACCGSRHLWKAKPETRCPLPAAPLEWTDSALTPPLLAAVRASQPPVEEEPPPDVQEQLRELEERRRRVTTTYSDPRARMTYQEYNAALMACDAEQLRLQPPRTGLQLETARTLADAWHNLTVPEQNAAIHELVKRAAWYVDRVVLEMQPTGWEGWPPEIVVPRG